MQLLRLRAAGQWHRLNRGLLLLLLLLWLWLWLNRQLLSLCRDGFQQLV
jgi:hypothetical protein